MTRLIRLKAAGRQALRAAAKSEANIINANELVTFLKEGIRWGLGINRMLDDIRVRRNSIDQWKANATAEGVALIFPPVPTWIEIDAAKLDERTDKNWWSKIITSAPGEEPVTDRKRKWSEVPRLQARTVATVVRYFAPASDGVEYFDQDTIDEIDLDPSVVSTMHIDQVPDQDELI